MIITLAVVTAVPWVYILLVVDLISLARASLNVFTLVSLRLLRMTPVLEFVPQIVVRSMGQRYTRLEFPLFSASRPYL